MSVEEKNAAGRWKKAENHFRYVREIAVGDGAMARLLAVRKAEREEGSETGPADLGGEM